VVDDGDGLHHRLHRPAVAVRGDAEHHVAGLVGEVTEIQLAECAGGWSPAPAGRPVAGDQHAAAERQLLGHCGGGADRVLRNHHSPTTGSTSGTTPYPTP